MRILVLCSGNICRSPMGEVLLAARLEERGATAEVLSAGFLTEDQPADPTVVELMAARDLDLREHRSQSITPALVGDADLVVGMARLHVREASLASPGAFGRTFTLKELVRLGDQLGGRRPDEAVDEWLRRVGADRSPAQLMGDSPADDIVDPVGRRMKVFRQVEAEIDELTRRLAELLAP